MAWYSVKKKKALGQLYLGLLLYKISNFRFLIKMKENASNSFQCPIVGYTFRE